MMVSDADQAQLKPWIVNKLEIISDADSDVLADYVMALVRADDAEPQLRQGVISNLEDFLKENTSSFVDELFSAIHLKSYVPGYTPPQPIATSSPTFNQSSSPTTLNAPNGTQNTINGMSRKRSFNHSMDSGDGRDSGYGRGERHFKQMRRGGNRDSYSSRGGRAGYSQQPTTPQSSALPALPFPPPPPGMNLEDSLAMMQTLQAMGLPPLPFPPPSSGSPPPFSSYGGHGSQNGALGKHVIDARCRDYDTKGFCTRGNTCPFQHGNEVVVPDQEYDPKNAVMADVQMSPTTPSGLNFPLSDPHANGHHNRGSYRGRGRGGTDRGGFNPRRFSRAEFSHTGPNNDRSIRTIVVEQIPEENFKEEDVRTFFSDFGPIEEVSMHAYKRLAIVKYSDNGSAYRAYNSPKVIFDNRFVKVFWYKPVAQTANVVSKGEEASMGSAAEPTSAEPAFDKGEFERNAQAAQKKLEEKNALKRDAEEKRQALEKQKEDLLQRQAEEKRKLQEKLAARGLPISEATNGVKSEANGASPVKDEKAKAHTQALRDHLANLEAEAKSLGLDTALSDPEPAYRGRGRGTYRGRGSYRGWEGFDPSYRGIPRGRGGYRGRGVAAAGNFSLDLRPKKVAIKAEGEFDDRKDESLRQFLLGLGEYENIEPCPTSTSTIIVSFKQRFEAEKLFYGSKDIPGVGKVEMSWVSSPQTTSTPTKQQSRIGDDVNMDGAEESGETVAATTNGKIAEHEYEAAEEDFDVAE